eukprot:GHVN01089638.1.p2 GENE.GHVN01089638.1~~GHVN01089638.1.p2  ORF type:complete len:531 (+),score=55.99 GHVN01089638.1:4403-5995(+)
MMSAESPDPSLDEESGDYTENDGHTVSRRRRLSRSCSPSQTRRGESTAKRHSPRDLSDTGDENSTLKDASQQVSREVRSLTPDPPLEDSLEESSAERRKRRRRTGWDDTSPSGLSSAGTGDATSPQDGDALAERQQQAANIAAQMQSKASQSQLCRIYIGSLDYSLTEADIRQVLESFGQVVNIDMPKEGNRSKGFCFVEYATPEAAEMVLTTLQGFELKGRPIKVGRPTAMGGVPKDIGVLSPSSAVPVSADPAAAGIMAAASLLANRTCSSVPLAPSPVATAPPPALPTSLTPTHMFGGQPSQNSGINRIYVGSVPYSFSAEDVKQIFQVFGTIISCQLIPSNERPGTHRGYGFIEYQTVAQAKMAIDTMNGFSVSGKQLKVNHATALRNSMQPPPTVPAVVGQGPLQMPSLQQVPGAEPSFPQLQMGSMCAPGVAGAKMIMLTNMVTPDKVDDDLQDELRTECSKYGEVNNVTVKIVGNDVRVFVQFAREQDAAQAIPQLHNRWFDGRQIVCRTYDESQFNAGFFTL